MSADRYVYKHYAATGELLYVGLTSDMRRRQRNHEQRTEWWPFVERVTQIGPLRADLATELELRLIRACRPVFNVRHNGRSIVQHAADAALGEPVEQWATRLRTGDRPPSWRRLSLNLRELSGRRVDVCPSTLQAWTEVAA